LTLGVGRAWPRLRDALTVALPGWLTARVVVLSAIPLSHYIANHLHGHVAKTVHQGLLSWDGQWYERIASGGYGGVPRTAVRFFPLYPFTAKVVSFLFAGAVDIGLLVLANAAALLYGALLVLLVRRELADTEAARRAGWLVALAPSAFVLVFAYSEAIAGCLAVGMFLSLRSRRWWWAALAGFLSGLTRPSGAVLAVPALVEGIRGLRRAGGVPAREVIARLTAVAAPVAGVVTYLVYIGLRFDKPMLPITVQNRPWLRGGFSNPLSSAWRAGRLAFTGHFGGNGIHFPLVALAIVLVVVVCWRWPASYGAYAVATLLVALSAKRLGSVERYLFSAFPLILAGVSLTRSKRVEQGVLVASGACMGAFALLALLGAYVP